MSSRSGDRNQIVTVFQVATGNVGSEMIKRIQSHPDLELVGLHCYSRRQDRGRDAGEIVGAGPDRRHTAKMASLEEIVAACLDCDLPRGLPGPGAPCSGVLEAGIMIVTTADWIDPAITATADPLPSVGPQAVAGARGGRVVVQSPSTARGSTMARHRSSTAELTRPTPRPSSTCRA